eukprot:5044675-Pyramimonas_sp.AAC.1
MVRIGVRISTARSMIDMCAHPITNGAIPAGRCCRLSRGRSRGGGCPGTLPADRGGRSRCD